jgi:XTP/dITP diphosphohydrolase
MKVKRLILGTNNPGKVEEWSKLFKEYIPEMEIMSISEVGDYPEGEESGETFVENAQQKASHYAKLSGEFVFADDGGYEVDALGGKPGVRSRRILPGNKEGTDQELIDYVLGELRGVPKDKRTVSLSGAVAVSDPTGQIIFMDEVKFKGVVAEKPGPTLIPGYPFRAIHYLPEFGKTYAELTEEEHMKLSHKRPVAKRLSRFLIEY